MAKAAYISIPTVVGVLGNLGVGSIVLINEGGNPVEYLIVHQGNPNPNLYDQSCDGTWLLRKDIHSKRNWNSSSTNSYQSSTIHSYLNSTFIDSLDSDIQSAIKQVKIPYLNASGTVGLVDSGSKGLSTKIFLLSCHELGWTTEDYKYFPDGDGACLSYFNPEEIDTVKDLRLGYYNSAATPWWSRSPATSSSINVFNVNDTGGWSSTTCTSSIGIRPAFILPSSTSIDSDGFVTLETETTYVARNIKKYYVGGEDDKARRITRAYIGDSSGKATRFYDLRTPKITTVNLSSGLVLPAAFAGAYGGGTHVFLDNTGYILYSTNGGTSWSRSRSYYNNSNYRFDSVCYGGGKFVATITSDGYNKGKLAYSTNGTSWSAVSFGDNTHWSDICYGEGKFVIVGTNSVENKTIIAYSIDGQNWSITGEFYTSDGSITKSICYGEGVGFTTGAHYSSDGVNWLNTDISANIFDNNLIHYHSGEFVNRDEYFSTITGATTRKSTDGIHWTHHKCSLVGNSKIGDSAGASGGGVLLTFDDTNFNYSYDGIHWETIDFEGNGAPVYPDSMYYAEGAFYTLGANSLKLYKVVFEENI